MGRPIQKKYFANTNVALDGEGVGGEALSAVALGTAGSGYSQGLTATASAPQIAGGQNATLTVAVNPATGAITGYVVTEGGSGYTSAPTVTLVKPADAVTDATFTTGSADIEVVDATGIYVGMVAASTNITSSQTVDAIDGTTITLSAVPDGAGTDEEVTFSDEGASGVAGARTLSTAARANGIAAYAYIPASGTAGYISGTGGSSRVLGDIIRQSGNNKYVVQTAQGVGVCRLQADGSAANAAGEMDITATDWNGSTYRVTKLHARKAKLKQVTSSTAFLVADETWTKWTFGASTGTVVTISNN